MRQSWLRFDFVLFLCVVSLLCFGLTIIYSATTGVSASGGRLLDQPLARQALMGAIGLVLALALTAVDYGVLGFHPLAVLSPLTRQREQPAGLGLALHHEQFSDIERE